VKTHNRDVLADLDAEPTMTEAEADRLTQRIDLRLTTIADNTDAVIPMIKEARNGNAHQALGYRSWTEYVTERFGGTLARLGKADRLPFVELLAEQGMSTRAIAGVVGVSKDTVSRDLRAGVSDETPDQAAGELRLRPDEIDGLISSGMVENLDDLERCMKLADANDQEFDQALTEARRDDDLSGENVAKKIKKIIAKKTIGIDGKTYTRPPAPEPRKPRRSSFPDAYRNAVRDLDKATRRMEKLHADDRLLQHRQELKHLSDLMGEISWVVRELDEDLGGHPTKCSVCQEERLLPSRDWRDGDRRCEECR